MTATATSPDMPALHPAFGLAEETALHVATRYGAQEALHFFAASVARDHLNLRAHTQRILLMLDTQADAKTLLGALLDLFLALGEKGLALRTALLQRASAVLLPEDAAFLQGRLPQGLERLDVLPDSQGSVLDHAMSGESHLVVRQKAERKQDADAVDVAIMHLEHGDVTSAREVLEAAILTQPQDPAINNELLEIYRRSRDQAAFLAMRDTLNARGVQLSADWDEL